MAAISSAVSAQPLWQPNGNNVIYTQRLVGIFTDTPTKTLDINGSIRTRGSALFDSAMQVNGSFKALQFTGASAGLVQTSAAGVFSRFEFSGNAGEVLTGAGTFNSISTLTGWTKNGTLLFTDAEKVGIGTPAPVSKLDVNGSVKIRGKEIVDSALLVSGDVQFTKLATSSTGLVRAGTGGQLSTLQFNGSTTQVLLGNGTFADISATSGWKIIGNDLIFQPSGKMGVGIMVPTEKIDVQGNMRVRGRIYVDDGITILGTASGDKFEPDTMKTKIIEMDSTSLIVGETRIDGDGSFTGNLGLGTTNPTEKLEVAGNIKASGTVFANQLSINSNITAPSFSGINQLQLKVNSNIVAVFNAAGNMGIGTPNPTERLDVSGNARIKDSLLVGRTLRIDNLAGEGWKPDSVSTKSYKMVYADESGKLTTDILKDIPGGSACGIASPAWMLGGNNVWPSNSQPLNPPDWIGSCDYYPFRMFTNNTERMRITADGFVGIGTSNPRAMLEIVYTSSNPDPAPIILAGTSTDVNFRVNTDGWCYAREFHVATYSFWDCVFEEDYPLMTISELDEYIQQNKHLPDVPPEKEVIKNGLDLSEFTKTLLKQNEEQYLYIIELNKEVEELQRENKEILNILNELLSNQ